MEVKERTYSVGIKKSFMSRCHYKKRDIPGYLIITMSNSPFLTVFRGRDYSTVII